MVRLPCEACEVYDPDECITVTGNGRIELFGNTINIYQGRADDACIVGMMRLSKEQMQIWIRALQRVVDDVPENCPKCGFEYRWDLDFDSEQGKWLVVRRCCKCGDKHIF